MDASIPIGFLCTGPSTGFDPLCNTAHTEFVLALTIIALIAGLALGLRLTRGRHRLVRTAAGLAVGMAGAVVGFLVSLGLGAAWFG